MKIIQAPQVAQETMALLAEKAKLEDELHKLVTHIRESQESLADMMSRQRSLEESFIGNAEWLSKIKALQTAYKEEMVNLEKLLERKEKANEEVYHLERLLKEISLSITRLEDTKSVKEKEIEDIQKKTSQETELLNKIIAEQNKVSDSLVDVKKEKAQIEEDLARIRGEWSLEDQEMGKKRLDLQVYEQRILREYAILFPEVKKGV